MADTRVDVSVNFTQDGHIKPMMLKINGKKYNIRRASCVARLFLVELEDGCVMGLKYDTEAGAWFLHDNERPNPTAPKR